MDLKHTRQVLSGSFRYLVGQDVYDLRAIAEEKAPGVCLPSAKVDPGLRGGYIGTQGAAGAKRRCATGRYELFGRLCPFALGEFHRELSSSGSDANSTAVMPEPGGSLRPN